MAERNISTLALGLGIFFLITFYAGHINQLNLAVVIVALLLSFASAFMLVKKHPFRPLQKSTTLALAGLVVALIFLLALSMPDGIFKNTCSDVNNHARAIRLGTFGQTIFTNDLDMDTSLSAALPLHEAPILWIGGFIGLNTIFHDTYPVVFLFSALLEVLSVIAIFFIARELYNDKTALLSLFLAGFSIITFYLLNHGFIPQIAGSFCVLWAFLFFIQKRYVASGIMGAASFAYPPLFFVFGLFVTFSFLSEWKKYHKRPNLHSYFIVLALSIVLPLVEIIELLVGRLPAFLGRGGFELIRGGIAVPHPLLLIAFIPALYAFYYFWKNKEGNNQLTYFLMAIGVGLLYVFGAFALNFLVHAVSIQIHRLYMAVKFFYFLIWPISIVAAAGFMHLYEKKSKKINILLSLLLIAHLLFFVGYLFALPQERENFPTPIYTLSDQLSTLPGPFFIGVDSNLLVNNYQVPFLYAPFFDNPDDGPGKCPKIEINRLFEFPWARHELDWDDAYFRAVDDQNNWIVKYSSMDTNYFLTNQKLPFPIILTQGNYYVYQISTQVDEKEST